MLRFFRIITPLTLCILGPSPALAQPSPGVSPRRKYTLPRWPHRADPKPLVTRHYLDLKIKLKNGKVKVLAIKRGSYGKGPRLLPRFRGRFEVRLFSARLLRDVIRFDFPLTAGSDPQQRDKFVKGVVAQMTIRLPFDSTITDLQIVDTMHKAIVPVNLRSVRLNRSKLKGRPTLRLKHVPNAPKTN